MKGSRHFMRFYIVPVVLLAGILLTAGFTVFYTVTARTREGALVASNWPKTFTFEFAQELYRSEGRPAITDAGKARLDRYGLWVQVLDADGTEVVHYHKPTQTPRSYKPYELLQLYQKGSGTYSVFISSVEMDGVPYAYLIGFPLSISKVVMYVDTARYHSGKALVITVIALTAILVMTLTIYSYRSFHAVERRREQDEKAKEEWLANITHDLKTPLAPIRGYAELLEDPLPKLNIQRYAAIILKNTLYAEQLVDDLKLTYQLQSNMLPLKAETQNITRFVREVMIDILNAPEYEGRGMTFHTVQEELYMSFDAQLLRRAMVNVVVNALKHNKPSTEIAVTIDCDPGIKIMVADKGSGMSPQELEGLFKRYYRGTNTEAKTEGSGLGMAIAKQIVEAHGGQIYAQSKADAGTTVVMAFPPAFKV